MEHRDAFKSPDKSAAGPEILVSLRPVRERREGRGDCGEDRERESGREALEVGDDH